MARGRNKFDKRDAKERAVKALNEDGISVQCRVRDGFLTNVCDVRHEKTILESWTRR